MRFAGHWALEMRIQIARWCGLQSFQGEFGRLIAIGYLCSRLQGACIFLYSARNQFLQLCLGSCICTFIPNSQSSMVLAVYQGSLSGPRSSGCQLLR